MRALVYAILSLPVVCPPVLAVTPITDWGIIVGISNQTHVLADDIVEPALLQGIEQDTDDATMLRAAGRAVPSSMAQAFSRAFSMTAGYRRHHLCGIKVVDCEFSAGVRLGAGDSLIWEVTGNYLS